MTEASSQKQLRQIIRTEFALAHLDSSLNFMRTARTQTGKRRYVAKALQTLDKAFKTIFGLAYEKDGERRSSRTREERKAKKRLSASKLNEAELDLIKRPARVFFLAISISSKKT